VKVRHAFTGHVYERISEGVVKVVDPATGQEGIFNEKGQWQSGDLKYADFHMCGNVGGKQASLAMESVLAGGQQDGSDGASGS
jgi:hypothetical protein